MYDYDDFYNEPSEFDMQVDEFKQSLLNAVKDEYKAEMERLRKENEELQKVKRDWQNIQREYAEKVRSLAYEKSDLERKMRRARLTELIKDYEVILYHPDYELVYGPKCNKCNEQRQISYSSPSGKKLTEACECAERRRVYKPAEYIRKEFRQQRHGGNQEVIAWYRPSKQDEDDYVLSSSTLCETIYTDGMNYSELDQHRTFFRTEKECQAYCDWLTAEAAKEATHG